MTMIDVRLGEGQETIAKLRAELAQTSQALEKAQGVLANGDHVLAQIDAGLELAEAAIGKGRRVFPKVAVFVAVISVGAVTFAVIKRRGSGTADAEASGWSEPSAAESAGTASADSSTAEAPE